MTRELRRDINVTPLVDIVLVLLIVFIVVAPAVDASVALPAAKHAVKGAAPEGPRISLRREGRHALATLELQGRAARTFRVGEEGDPAALAAALRSLAQGSGERTVTVKADAALSNALVGDLLEACRAGGVTRATFTTREDAAPKTGRL
ncbi:MAG: biopolymer transporter ExbD [Holophagaceae bacterium]|nr:biopolymer transporter ExbD [Holophagaceae bacterium]